jgi:endoribonuclease LACTB2
MSSKLRPAAGVIPVRKVDGRTEVYLVQRGFGGRFFPGYHAFPGGAGEKADLTLAQELLGDDSPQPVTALREFFEEVGGWLGSGRPDRQQLETQSFAELVQKFPPDWTALRRAGLRNTPDYALVRFSAQFYLLDLTNQRDLELSVIPGELECGQWWDLAEALTSWKGARIFLAPPTQRALSCLERHCEFEAAAQAMEDESPEAGSFITVWPNLAYIPMKTATLPPAQHTLCYLIEEPSGCLIVDPGSDEPSQLEHLKATLASRKQAPIAALFTHHHPDHVGGLDWCRQQGLPLWMHDATARLLGLQAGEFVSIEDGRAWEQLEFLHTPGHASGHLALWWPKQKALMAADLISGLSTIIIQPPDGSMGQYYSSLERCIALEPKLLLCSHGGPFGPNSGVLEKTLAHRRQREAKVADALAKGLSGEELLAEVYSDTDPKLWPLAQASLDAHLKHLATGN